MNKKNLIVILISIIVILAVAIGLYYFTAYLDGTENNSIGKTGYEQAAEALDVDFNADIMVYGEEPGFIEAVKWRKIDKITDETLNYDEPHGYRAIVLFDYKGTMVITDEELLLIKSYVEEKGYDMFYIGRQYLDDFKRLKFTKGCEPEEISLEYIGSINYGRNVQQNDVGNMYAYHGLWNEGDEEEVGDNPNMLRQIIIMTMNDYAKEANGVKDEFNDYE